MSIPNCIYPHALYIHYAEMDGTNATCTEENVDDDNGIGSQLEKVTPMRVFAKIVEKSDDGIISFRWAKDKRNLQRYQDDLNEHYRGEMVDETIGLKEDTTYIIRVDDVNFYRCQISNVFARLEKTVHLIDYGKTITVSEADFYYYHDTESWQEDYAFAFAGHCRIADKNQCLQLGLPLSDEFVVGEEVEIFLLSPHEPYYAVVSSLRNPEAKLLDTTLTCDLLPNMANAWNDVTANYLSPEPADRPTLLLSPKWIHGNNPVLVTVPYIESLDKVAVCDLLCSLRSCILSEYLRGNYEKLNVRCALRVTDPFNQIEIGVVVVALDPRSNRYYRARVCEVNASLTLVDLVGIDTPQWKSFNHPLINIWLLSKTLETLPRMLHYVPLRRNLGFGSDIKLLLSDYAACKCEPQSIALLQHYDETLEPQFVIPDSGNQLQKLIDVLPTQNSISRFSSRISLASNSSKKTWLKKWDNKSKKSVKSFKSIDDKTSIPAAVE